jgi:DNA invertase Pin-like site-specific DNA recombinase
LPGCRTEKQSGKSRKGRDQLATLLEFIGPGDVLVCVKLDRLGHSTRDVLNLVHELDQKGAFLRILEPAISTDGPMGKMVLTVLGMVAEMELGFIKARQRDGIDRAKSVRDLCARVHKDAAESAGNRPGPAPIPWQPFHTRVRK